MLALQLSRVPIRSSRILGRLFSTLLVYFCICPSHAQIIPECITRALTRQQEYAIHHASRKKGENFPKDFAIAMGAAVVGVTIVATLVCVFAHCWRPILDCGWGGDRKITRKMRRKDEEAWFCGADRGLPMPQFDVLEPETEPLALSTQAPERDTDPGLLHGYHAPAMYARNPIPSARTGPKGHWGSSRATLPSWLDQEEIERPTTVAHSSELMIWMPRVFLGWSSSGSIMNL
ncbi:hypothetical protein F4803DRAFT_574878 [Xylaria telfairii]|nr:hypothetical protein F4803DRAFT_574878 [Xylaria telfairii]